MEFEFDKAKSEANKRKHGVSLEDATQIWQQAYLEVAARTIDEPRFMAIGRIRDRLYACIYTPRGEAIRLISCRRAREKEARLYDEYLEEESRKGESESD